MSFLFFCFLMTDERRKLVWMLFDWWLAARVCFGLAGGGGVFFGWLVGWLAV